MLASASRVESEGPDRSDVIREGIRVCTDSRAGAAPGTMFGEYEACLHACVRSDDVFVLRQLLANVCST